MSEFYPLISPLIFSNLPKILTNSSNHQNQFNQFNPGQDKTFIFF